MKSLADYEVWFITGSQHLYGPETLKRVDEDSGRMAAGLNDSGALPLRLVWKPVVTGPEAIERILREADNAPACAGAAVWMHTFSPAKMWIAGLASFRKPLCHLHTQFNRDIPWSAIDMDFMNLNQSAHGDREFGFIAARLRLETTVIAGHWQDAAVAAGLAEWMRAAAAWQATRTMKVARFGDNMREVAVTEGDKVAAQRVFGYSVNGYGVGDLARRVAEAGDAEADRLAAEYRGLYRMPAGLDAAGKSSLREAARIELGLRAFLAEGGFEAFTTTFEDLHGLAQLPGLAVQRLMADGYGFGAEGDWKTAALVRAMKVMAGGLKGGTSFMEDYTYHLEPGRQAVLGAHMLEVCPSIAAGRPSLELHPLSIGGKADPARLVFSAPPGPAVNASIIDLGDRFRLILNEVEVIEPPQALPRLPVARALWMPKPDLPTAAAAWIVAGGAHHTSFSQALGANQLALYAEMAGIECVVIDERTRLADFRKELRWNEAAFRLSRGY